MALIIFSVFQFAWEANNNISLRSSASSSVILMIWRHAVGAASLTHNSSKRLLLLIIHFTASRNICIFCSLIQKKKAIVRSSKKVNYVCISKNCSRFVHHEWIFARACSCAWFAPWYHHRTHDTKHTIQTNTDRNTHTRARGNLLSLKATHTFRLETTTQKWDILHFTSFGDY